MLGLRLDRPLELDGLECADRPRGSSSAWPTPGCWPASRDGIRLSERGRFMANDVVSTLLR